MTQNGVREIKNKTKALLYKLPEPVIQLFYQGYSYVKYPDLREKRMSFGVKNPDITFYIIRPRTDCVEGLMALVTSVLQHLNYAQERGYVPVVDFERYNTQYRDNKNEITNVWEYYFHQVSPYSLEEVYQSKNVVLSGLGVNAVAPSYLRRDFSSGALELAKELWSKYIDYTDQVKVLVSQEEKLIHPKDCIGLYLRGTDYTALRPAGEEIQPNANQAFMVVDQMCRKYNKKYVYLVTEDATLYEKTINRYGDFVRIVSYDTFIKSYTGDVFLSKGQAINELSISPYQRGMKYLVKLILLSECKAIVGGNTCGSWTSCLMSPSETEKCIFQLGKY